MSVYKTVVPLVYLSSDNCVAAYWEIYAHSAYDTFSMYKYLIVNLVFLEWELLSDCAFS